MSDKCVLCGSVGYEIISNKLRYDKPGTIVTCSECGLTRLLGALDYAEKLNEYYADQYAQKYHPGVKKDLDSLFDSFLPVQAERVNRVKPYLKETHRVLEVGSSAGYFLASIKSLVAEAQGLELNRSEAHYANEFKNIPTTDVPLENCELPTNYYDHICLFQVLEHVSNPIEFLRLLQKYLRSEGKIHIEVPNLRDPLVSFYDIEEYRNFYYQEPHLYYFTVDTLKKVCSMAGFKKIEAVGFQQTSFVNNLNWVFMRRPQNSRWDCMRPVLPKGAIRVDVSASLKKEFEVFMDGINNSYVQFMEKNGLADMLFATIGM